MKVSLISKSLGMLGASLLACTISVHAEDSTEAIYTMDNAAGGNHVLAWKRAENGALAGAAMYGTGGAGTGAGLSSQSSLALSRDGHWLLVCNAGSAEISVFAVLPEGLQLTDKTGSGGRTPLSLALNENLIYVLNAGGGAGDKDNITGFRLTDGKLVPVPDSTRALSADNTGPAQVSFTKDGDVLVVTERTTSLIDTFTVSDGGLASSHKVFQSVGVTPFGFAVGRRDRIFVSEAGTTPSSASSYLVSETGDIEVISAAVPTKQAAACWLIGSHDGRFVYTANAGSGTLSGYSVGTDGSLALLSPDGITASIGAGSHPIDMTLSHDGRFLFSLANGNGTLHVFRTSHDGSLEPLGSVSGIPSSAAGLAGR